jgi:putative ABC transport system permease protein
VIRLYRVLLRCYPASFRREFEDEMAAVFAADLDRARGLPGRLWLLLVAVADVVPTALAAHWELLRQDLRYTGRTLNHARGFALAAILITAIGVGANTAAFSVADFVLLRPLPYADAEELVRLCEGPRQGAGWGCMNELSPANYRDVRDGNTVFEALGAYTGASMVLVGGGEPLRLPGAAVTAEVLPLLGVPPLLGRVFDSTAAGQRDAGTAVIGYGLWQARFGGDPGVVGRTVNLDGGPREVIGVMPAGFHFPARDTQLWTPLVLCEEDFADRNDTYLQGIARLRDGVTLDQARAELSLIFARLARDFPESNAETWFSFFRLRDDMSPRYRLMLTVLCGASLGVLLLTCANLANLLLARAAARDRELAVRAALGAGRERLVRQLFTESVVLAVMGGALGVVVAMLAVPLLSRLVPNTLPIAARPQLDLRVLGLAAVFAGLTGLGFGLIPALRAGGRTGLAALREGARSGGGRKQRLRRVLVTVEVAVSVALLACSGLLIRAVWQVQAVDPGFAPHGVLTLRSELPLPQYDSVPRRTEFYRMVLAGVQALPGVAAAAYTSGLPMVLTGGIAGVDVPGREVVSGRREGVSVRWVSPAFFDALRIPVRRGRGVDDADAADRLLVAVVSESFARRYWPGQDALGRTFRVRDQDRTVVGVVGDIKVRGLERTSEPQVYLPIGQVPDGFGGLYHPKDLVIRFAGRAGELAAAVGRIIRAADPDLPITNVRMMADVVAGETATRRAQLGVLGALAGIAVLLAGVGIHGLLAYTVAQRSPEIGVRLALGAEAGGIARLVVREGLLLAVLGIVPGVAIAYAAARAMGALLFGVPPGDPVTMIAAVALILVMTLAGSLLPAWRAVRVSPMSVMRAE